MTELIELIKEYKRLTEYKAGMNWREDTTEITDAINDIRYKILKNKNLTEEQFQICDLFLANWRNL